MSDDNPLSINNFLNPKYLTMKPSALVTLSLVFLMLSATSFSMRDLLYTVEIQGIENKDVLKDGVNPSEMTQLTIGVNEKTTKIAEFEIVLARGKSPVGFPATKVKGNKYDLTKFRKIAKSGDRIVIDVKRLATSNTEEVMVRNIILQIPVK